MQLDATKHDKSSQCVDCPTGKYTSFDGSKSCEDCDAGTFNGGTGKGLRISCGICTHGQYSSAGATTCTACASGRFISDLGLDVTFHDHGNDCEICSHGKYSDASAGTCLPCAGGKYIDDDGKKDTRIIKLSSENGVFQNPLYTTSSGIDNNNITDDETKKD